MLFRSGVDVDAENVFFRGRSLGRGHRAGAQIVHRFEADGLARNKHPPAAVGDDYAQRVGCGDATKRVA